MKHTPGPWVVNDFCTEGGADTAIWTSHDPHTAKSICECHFETHADLMRGEIGCHQLEAEANAKLIAAAPDLLAGAQRAYNFMLNTQREHGIADDSEQEFETTKLLRAAIAKATE